MRLTQTAVAVVLYSIVSSGNLSEIHEIPAFGPSSGAPNASRVFNYRAYAALPPQTAQQQKNPENHKHPALIPRGQRAGLPLISH